MKARPGRLAAIACALGFLRIGPLPTVPALGEAPPPYAASDRYETRQVEGWTVLVHKDLLAAEPALAERALALLRFQLYQIIRRVPAKAVAKLRTVRIWVEQREPHNPCMTYHPDPAWLRDHGMNPAKARCVELCNVRHFLEWTIEQPWMVLHELAHAYHHQFLDDGFDNAGIRTTFEHARAARLYESVLDIKGREKKAYALTDPQEYFAESTEAFFGTNDFFPFVRPELRRHDAEMFARLETLWGTPPGP